MLDGYCVVCVFLFVCAAVVSTVAGSGAPTFVDATGTAAGFNDVLGVTLDALGNIYVSDYGNRRIRKVSSAGGMYTASRPVLDHVSRNVVSCNLCLCLNLDCVGVTALL